MRKAVKQKGASFMKNVLILMFAQISVKLLGLIYRLVITMQKVLEILDLVIILRDIKFIRYF